jgi:lipoprotein-anchoring transpeptidase ErfK/SrfK
MKILALIFCFFILSIPVMAETILDTDQDGISDEAEINLYHSDPNQVDTDGDGYNDGIEIKTGFSPLNPDRVKLKDNDFDQDSVSDELEIKFKIDLTNPDTDGDGYTDGDEINTGYDPSNQEKIKLTKKIEINTGKEQKLYYFLGGVQIGEFKISSGKPSMPTPKGNYKIDAKALKAWSRYGLWMPYWMSLHNGYFGIHELPVWPNGYREGENHLGVPVSHGCVRLGIGPAKFLYDWAPIGTAVKIY